MGKRYLLTIMAAVLLTTSCGVTADHENESLSMNEVIESLVAENQAYENRIRERQAYANQTPVSQAPDRLEPLTQVEGFPVDLVNQIREAVYQNEVKALIAELADKDLAMTQFVQTDYGRGSAFFRYEDNDYLLTHEYDYSEELDCVALNLLSYEDDNLTVDKTICFKAQKELRDEEIKYAAEDYSDLADVVAYLQDCMEDVVWASREWYTFFGEGVSRSDLLVKFEESHPDWDMRLPAIYTIDVDNDGREEIYGIHSDRTIEWYDEDFHEVPVPYELMTFPSYNLKNTWFKKINGKVLVFSIYEKKSKVDCYRVRIQMVEQGETISLFSYLANLVTTDVLLSDHYFETYQQRKLVQQWQLPEYSEVYPDDMEQTVSNSVTEVTKYSYKIKCENDQNASVVVDDVQKLITSQQLYAVDDILGVPGKSLDISGFREKYYEYLKVYDPDCEGGFIPTIDAAYQIAYADQIYYLLFYYRAESGAGNHVDVYMAENGGLTYFRSNEISDWDSKIIQSSDGIFLVKRQRNDEEERYLPDITVHRLSSETEDIMVIRPNTTGFKWYPIYSDQLPHEARVCQYLEQIKDELMWESVSPEKNQFYVGDERTDFDANLQARLKSVSRRGFDLYQTDYNNDGQADYILRLRDDDFKIDYYHINDNRPVKIYYENSADKQPGPLIQTWFQEIDDQVFTFELFIKEGRYYILNVSLIKNTEVTPVQSYLIVPEVDYMIE